MPDLHEMQTTMADNAEAASVRPKVRQTKNVEVIVEPVDKRTIRFIDRQGNQRNFPALHMRFSLSLVYIKFEPLPCDQDADLIEWFDNVRLFERNLDMTLRLPYHRFWSTVQTESGFHVMLGSYLRKSRRFYEIQKCENLITDEMKSTLYSIHCLVFKIFYRMASHKESESEYLTVEKYFDIIYSGRVLDLVQIMNLCIVFYQLPIIRDLVANLFATIPKYSEDVVTSANVIMNSFDQFENRLGIETEKNNSSACKRGIDQLSWKQIAYNVNWLTDILVTLWSFIDIYHPAAKVYHQINCEERIAKFYEMSFVPLVIEIDSRQEALNDCRIKNCIEVSRLCLLKLFRSLILINYFEQLFSDKLTTLNKTHTIDELIDIMTTVASEKHFVKDYSLLYPFAEDIAALNDKRHVTLFDSVDPTRIDYILEAFHASGANHLNAHEMNANDNVGVWNDEGRNHNFVDETVRESTTIQGEAVGGLDDVTQMSLITSILDLLPDHGEGFIEACLNYYNNDAEKVINALLENNIPDPLKSLDRKMARSVIQKKPVAKIVDERKCIYDGDEFDIHRNNVDISKMHIGKRDKVEMAKVDNPTKEITMKLAQRVEEEYMANEYDDEYDDTYEESKDAVEVDKPNYDSLKRNENKETDSRRYESKDDNSQQRNNRFTLAKMKNGHAAIEQNYRYGIEENLNHQINFYDSEKSDVGEAGVSEVKAQQNTGQERSGGNQKRSQIELKLKEKNKAKIGNHDRKAAAQKKYNSQRF